MIDRYTKAVLTVIAVGLVWNIIVGTSVSKAVADGYSYQLSSIESKLDKLSDIATDVHRLANK